MKALRILSPYLAAIICGVIVGLVTLNFEIGVLTVVAVMFLTILYVWIRQAYWFITKTGDYENKNKKG